MHTFSGFQYVSSYSVSTHTLTPTHTLAVGDRHQHKVFLYTQVNDQWTLTQTLTPSHNDSCCGIDDWFGYEVHVYKNLLVVGAPDFSFDEDLTEAGIIYLYVKGEGGVWVEREALKAANPRKNGWFGSRIEVDTDFVVYTGRGVVWYRYAAGKIF